MFPRQRFWSLFQQFSSCSPQVVPYGIGRSLSLSIQPLLTWPFPSEILFVQSFQPLSIQLSLKQASKQAVAYCWHSPAWLFLVLSPIGTHYHIFVLIYNHYGIRRWASCSVRGGVGLFNAAALCLLFYLRLPFVCLLHIKEAEALPPRQGSSAWGWQLSLSSQSHIMTDDQSVSASWFRAPFGAQASKQ
jgi:hypothetical protein